MDCRSPVGKHDYALILLMVTYGLRAREVAALFGVGVRTLRRWRHEKRIPAPLKLKGPLRWRRTEVEAWLEDHRP